MQPPFVSNYPPARPTLPPPLTPDSDGIELMQAILAVADVPVIFLSAYGREDVVARALEMGPMITWSSPSPPRSWRPGSRRPCGGG